VIDDIKSRLDILEVVNGYVPLQRSGRSYKASCPFHQEKSPSFYVFPDRQSWRCFGGCATGGDIFSFVMKAESLEFGEALNRLAQQAGVTLPSREKRTEQKSALDINEAARAYFQQRLTSAQGAEARSYLESRGLDRLTIEKFELGLSPRDGESLKNHLVKQGFTLEQLAQAGVVSSGENGRQRDLFRNRLMIPIRNGQGELGGFGGRSLDDSNPKYLNSPRTPVFDKGRILYALYLARDAIKQQGAVVVEGYMDAIMAHQHGYNNVVASMGTALTEHQVAEVRRLTNNVVMALDADVAGQQATLRSLESSWRVLQTNIASLSGGTTLYQRQDDLDLKVAVLPTGQDPDQVIRQAPEDWPQLLAQASPLFQYLMSALSSQVDIITAPGKAWVAQRLYNFIAAVPEPIQQDYYFQLLANHLRINEDTLRASMSRFAAAQGGERPNRRRRSQNTAGGEAPSGGSAFSKLEHDPIEEHCLALLLQNPQVYDAVPELRPEYFRRPENREIVKYIAHAAADGFDESALEWLQQTVDQELATHLEYLMGKALPPGELQQQRRAVWESVHQLEVRYLRELKAEEALRFSEIPLDGLPEERFGETLEINQRFKQNEMVRNFSTQNVSDRR
jgi:DNA primase